MATTSGAGRSQRHLREIQGVDSAGDTDEIPVGIIPANTTPPILADTSPTMGDTLTDMSVTSGVWTGSPTPVLSKQIRKDNVPLVLPYTLTEADVGSIIVGRVFAVNVAGTVFLDTSPATVLALAITPDNDTLPSITNTTPRVGNVISNATIDVGTWTGYPEPTYNNQLKVNGVNKTMPYTILSGDLGLTMTVLVTATNIHGSGTATSLPTAAIQSSLASPVNTVLPSFTDTTPSVGDVITLANTSQGTWTGNPAPSLSSQLKRAGANVTMPYTVVEGDVGFTFTLAVTGTNSQGSATATSAATSAVPATSIAPVNTTLPSLTDSTPTVGDVINDASVLQGVWTGTPTPTYSNQLKVNGVNKTMPYTVVSGDIGNTITVTVTATNTAGSASATSSATGAVVAAPAAPVNTVAPTMVDTTPTVGDVISTAGINTGTWTGNPTPTYLKVLQRAGVDVTMPYTVVSGDVGVVFRGKVTATNTSGSVDAFTANTSAAVQAPAAPVNTVLPSLADQTPTVGDVINNASVNQGTWTGYPTPTLTNQLRRGTTNLTMPYTVISGDIGSTFNVQVTGTSTSGSATATSAATSAAVALPVAPANTVAPTITTTNNPPRVGDVITSGMLTNGTWTGTPTPSVNTDLRRGTTVLTMPYTIISGDIGQTFNAYATATNSAGSASQASTATAATTQAWAAPVNTVLPVFTDITPSVGDILNSPGSFTTGTWTGYPTPTYAYQLKKNGSNISMPYTIVSGDVAASFTVTVTATSSAGSASATSTGYSVTAAPTNSVVPYILNYQPEVGYIFNTSRITPGTWSGSPTSYSYQLKKNGTNVTMPYTVVSGDIGATFTVVETATNAGGSNTATSAATQAAIAGPTAPILLPSNYDASAVLPYWNGGPKIRIWGRNWYLDSAQKSYHLTSLDDKTIRFEVHQGDQFIKTGFSDSTGTTRNKVTLDDLDWFSPTYDIRFTGPIVFADGIPTTSTFWTFMEIHTFGSAYMLATKFEMFNRNGKFGCAAGYNPTSTTTDTRTLWDYLTPGTNGAPTIVANTVYNFDIFIRSSQNAALGRVYLAINGTVHVNFTGKVGFINETQVAPEFGIYRGSNNPSEPAVMLHGKHDWQWGVGLTDPGGPPPPTYGPELLSGQQPITSVTGWTASGCTRAITSGYLRETTTATGYGANVSRSFATTIGDTYEVVCVMKNGTATNIYCAISGSSVFAASNTITATTDQTETFTFVADSTSTSVFLHTYHATLTGKLGDFKSVSIRKKS